MAQPHSVVGSVEVAGDMIFGAIMQHGYAFQLAKVVFVFFRSS
jgi:hypothetical protein